MVKVEMNSRSPNLDMTSGSDAVLNDQSFWAQLFWGLFDYLLFESCSIRGHISRYRSRVFVLKVHVDREIVELWICEILSTVDADICWFLIGPENPVTSWISWNSAKNGSFQPIRSRFVQLKSLLQQGSCNTWRIVATMFHCLRSPLSTVFS